MKIAAIVHAIERYNESGKKPVQYRLVHIGQHYDKNMSDTFFEELGIPAPDVNLGCGGGTQAEQTAHIMVEFEKELLAHPTDVVLVVGDVTSNYGLFDRGEETEYQSVPCGGRNQVLGSDHA